MPMEFFQGESYSLRGVAFFMHQRYTENRDSVGSSIHKGEVKAWIIIKKQLN